MKSFTYSRPQFLGEALHQSAQHQGAKFLAGGTNLVDLMKENVEKPDHLVDINRLPLARVETTAEGGLRIGALVTNADLADHPEVLERYPLLAQALLAGASPQLRNMATTGGNLLQRTRCPYFYDTAASCNKRVAGSGCAACTGYNRMHAILGTSDSCVATHPSDMCVAMAALEARIHVSGSEGERVVAMADFHRLPGDTPHLDSNLQPGELITAVVLPPRGFAGHSHYLKLRDRASYAFALVSVAAALEIEEESGQVREARLALGGVAHKPWRNPEAEALLAGGSPDEETFRRAADLIVEPAVGLEHNAFKIELARRAIVRALQTAYTQGRGAV